MNDITKMTKAELVAHGASLGVTVPETKRDDMIAFLSAEIAKREAATGADEGEAETEADATPTLPPEVAAREAENNALRDAIIERQTGAVESGYFVVTLKRWPESAGMTLMVNGKLHRIPIGKPTRLPKYTYSALLSTNAEYTIGADA